MSYELEDIRFREPAINRMLESTSGEVGRYMAIVGTRILEGARRIVGVSSRRLQASLYMRHERTARGQVVTVGSPLDYAYVHHEGSRPHQIIARGGRVLRFNEGGRVVYARQVNHPGFRGKKYLTIPLRRAVRG